MSERPGVSVHLLPALIPEGSLRGGAAVVVDVLRATTTIVHALDAGADRVVPCLEIDQALALAAGMPPGTAVLAGERTGLPIEGFDLGNSPSGATRQVCRGKSLIMTTTNGTRAILASLDAEAVFIGAFVNLAATVRALLATARPLHVVCSGTDGLVCYEDTLLAGAIAARLGYDGVEPANDEALLARDLWLDADDRLGVAAAIARGRGGRRVVAIGLAADLADAARVDRFDLVAGLRRDPLRIVRFDPV